MDTSPEHTTDDEETGTNPATCPRCGSPEARLHPAVGGGGEVTAQCPDKYHSPQQNISQTPTPQRRVDDF